MKVSGIVLITPEVLRGLGLPRPDETDDKEGRGRVLIIGGSREMPGAAVLAGVAALRAGAGKLRIATVESVAAQVAVAVPEARVYSLKETRGGDIAASASERLAKLIEKVDAVCVGPGMIEERSAARLAHGFLKQTFGAKLVFDANAITALSSGAKMFEKLASRFVITPHAEEMAGLLGVEEDEVGKSPERFARLAAEEFGATVALKGRETFIAEAGSERTFCNRAGNVGLATSGSGDVLAGLIAGLLARGAEALAAAAWGVHTHALAGDALAEKQGRLGFLARELLDEIPKVLSRLEGRESKKAKVKGLC